MNPLSVSSLIFVSVIATGYAAVPRPAPAAVLCTLSLEQCFTLGRDNNASLHAAIDAIRQTRGEEISTISRLLPHLNLIYRGTTTDSIGSGVTDGNGLDLELRQRIVEFGETNPLELDRIRRQRKAVYTREDEIVRIFSSVRISYFNLRIIQEQLATHDSLLALYKTKLGEAQSRLEKGVGHKPEMLQARLNFLEERERIIGLRRQRQQERASLRELLGGATLSDSIRLITPQSSLRAPADTCVALAMGGNTEIADARAEAELAHRSLLEKGWTIAPDIHLTAGYQNGPNSAALELSNARPDARRTWALDAVGSHSIVGASNTLVNAGDLADSPYPFRDTGARYSASLAISLPVFKGLKRVGDAMQAGAAYNQARDLVLVKTHELERQILNAYYDFQLSLEELDIQREKVDISRERYSLAETQLEVGRISDVDVDIYRRDVFSSQDNYFAKQFEVLQKEEALRKLVRKFD